MQVGATNGLIKSRNNNKLKVINKTKYTVKINDLETLLKEIQVSCWRGTDTLELRTNTMKRPL